MKFLKELNEEQRKAAVHGKGPALIIAGAGTGKGFKNGTPIPSPIGEIPVEKLEIGSKIFTKTGKITDVTGVFPQGTKTIYQICFNDGTKIECDDTHIWRVGSDSLAGKMIDVSTEDLFNVMSNDNPYIEYADEAVTFADVGTPPLPAPAFCDMLAIFVRDPDFADHKDKYVDIFSDVTPDTIRIPDSYKYGSISTRELIVSGMMRNFSSFSGEPGSLKINILSPNPGFHKDLLFILDSLAIPAFDLSSEYQGLYALKVDESAKQRKIAWIRKQGYMAETTCIKVSDPSELFLAGERFLVTHNTKTLVSRLAYLTHRGVAPKNILLLTFTRKAAEEMMVRASVHMKGDGKVSGGTFHHFAHRILPKYAKEIGFKGSFSILDVPDSQTVVKLTMEEKVRPNGFPSKETVLGIFSRAINAHIPIKEAIETYFGDKEYSEDVVESIIDCHKEYQRYKQKHSFMDFDDLLYYTYRLLAKNPDVRKEFAHDYKFVMCDEYQDTNVLQAKILRLMTHHTQNLVVCGDPRQSIYAFRAAEYKNIIHFPDNYDDCAVYSLNVNYRSTDAILDLTNSIIPDNETFRNDLTPARKVENPHKPVFYQAADDLDQARYICTIVKRRMAEVRPEEIVVMSRAAYLLNHIEIEMKRLKIKFVKYGGPQFTESAHVKDMLHLMRLTISPHDAVALARILSNVPGVGAVNVARITDSIMDNPGYDGFTAFSNQRFHGDLLKLMKALVEAGEYATPSLVLKRLMEYYEPTLKKKFGDDERRSYDLQTLMDIAKTFKTVRQMVNDLTLDPSQDKKDKEKGAVVLATCHYTKGMEFDTVILVNLTDKTLPSKYARTQEEIEEERRIFYVATTRAENRLYMTAPVTDIEQEKQAGYSHEGGQTLSRFVFDMGNFFDLTKHVQSKAMRDDAPKPIYNSPGPRGSRFNSQNFKRRKKG